VRNAEGLLTTREAFSLRDLVRVIVRRRVLVATIFVMTLGSVATATFLATPIYESTAILLIKFGREFMNAQKASLPETPVSQVVNTEIAILRTNEVIEGVVAAVGPLVLYPGLANPGEGGVAMDSSLPSDLDGEPAQRSPVALATSRFAANLRIEGMPDTQVIQISFQHPDPVIAAEAVNLLIDRFKEKHLSAFGEAGATAFLKEQVDTYRKKLDEDEDRVRAFLVENAGFAIGDIGNVMARERRELASELSSVQRETAASRRELAHLKKERAGLSRYEAFDLQERLDEQIQAMMASLSGLEAREASLKKEISRADRELAEVPALHKEYQRLLRERDSNGRLYESYSKQLEAALVSEKMDRQKIANIVVLQAGLVPSSPVRPRKMLNLVVGTLVAGALGVLAALLVEAGRPRSG
jgi:uncharacterized protein involved in exopolysaccharide biosynthesis